MKRGDIIYARIIVADKLLDVELTCTVSCGIKKDWSTGESVSILLIIMYTTYNTNTHVRYIHLISLTYNLITYVIRTIPQIYGELAGDGVLVKLPSVSDVRGLLLPNCAILNALGKKFQYEVCLTITIVCAMCSYLPFSCIRVYHFNYIYVIS